MIRGTIISLSIPTFVIVSLLLVPALGIETPSEPVRVTENPTRELAGRHVMVRIYNEWQSDPRAYKLISVP